MRKINVSTNLLRRKTLIYSVMRMCFHGEEKWNTSWKYRGQRGTCRGKYYECIHMNLSIYLLQPNRVSFFWLRTAKMKVSLHFTKHLFAHYHAPINKFIYKFREKRKKKSSTLFLYVELLKTISHCTACSL